MVIDLAAHSVHVTSAGHLPPLLVHDGKSEFLHSEVGLPIGVDTNSSYESSSFAVPRGASLLGFTDGLIERHGESLDDGLERLRLTAVDASGDLTGDDGPDPRARERTGVGRRHRDRGGPMGELDADAPRLSHRVVSNAAGRVVLALGGELDLATVAELATAVDDTVAAATDLLVLDVEQLRFADSSALALWVSWSQRVPRVEVHNARPLIRRVIEAMGLNTRLNPT